MHKLRIHLALFLICALTTACGDDAAGTKSSGAAGSGSGSSTSKDRGEARMQLGEEAWSAKSTKATLRGDRLTIRASRMDMGGDKAVRDELHLALRDFQGPGEYTAGVSGSRFVRVAINTKRVADGDDAKVTEEAAKALTGAKHKMLMGAKVTITAASDSEVSGTFSWTPPGGRGEKITEGSFRAPVRK